MHDIQTNVPHPARLWSGFIGSPIIWIVHFMVVWATAEGGCFVGLGEQQVLGISAVQTTVVAASVLALALIAGLGWVAYRNHRSIRSSEPPPTEFVGRAAERARFMSVGGLIFSGIFFIMVFLTMLPVFVLPACDL